MNKLISCPFESIKKVYQTVRIIIKSLLGHAAGSMANGSNVILNFHSRRTSTQTRSPSEKIKHTVF